MTNSVIKTRVVGIDIGVNETSIAIVDLRGTILAQDTLKTSDFPLVDDFVEALSERIARGLSEWLAGSAVLLVTHSEREAQLLGCRVLRYRDGRFEK